MKVDIRSEAAKYYDLNPNFPPDVPFYQALIPSPRAVVLELGCGTGRVTIPLARQCRFLRGLDLSPAMIQLCRTKLAKANIPPHQAFVSEGDITNFDFGQHFDLILAPFRVLQNLETDAEVHGLFSCIGKHLAPGGTCVLNVFRPFYAPNELRERWLASGERLNWEVPRGSGTVTCYDRRWQLDEQRLVLYPDLVYRCYEGTTLVEEVVLHLVMRCYYPETFEKVITAHGFRIMKRWGGYAGEAYGEGPELVVQFQAGG
jgi:SAM-dependent methyltransferase